MENVEVINELEIKRPTFNGVINVDIPEVSEVSHNLDNLEKFAIQLKEYYGKLVFSDENSKEAENERKRINALIKEVENIRKEKVAEYKKPIDDFEQTAKRIEKTLKEAKESVQVFIDKAEEKRRKDKYTKIIEPIMNTLISNAFVKGYLIDKEKILIDNRWYNKTFKDDEIEKDINAQIDEFIRQEDDYKKGLDIIVSTLEMASNMSVEKDFDKYKERFTYTRDLNSILEDIKYENRIKELSREVIDNSNMFDVPVKVSKTFVGTNEQMNKLVEYAKQLGMEEVKYYG